MGDIRREEGVRAGCGALDQGRGRGEGTSSKSLLRAGHVGPWTVACPRPHLSKHLLANEMLSQAQESWGPGP